MKTYHVSLTLVGLLLIALAVMSGCKEDPPTSLYDDPTTNVGTAPQPVVSAVDPPGAALAGVTTVTISGSNFSAVKDENIVYFDATKANILSASATQLVVRAPTLVKDSVTLRVMVYKAVLSSTPRQYKLLAAVTEYGNLGKLEDPYAIATDAAGNMYVSISGSGVKKVTPDGTRTDYSAHAAGVTKWSAMKIGPAGVLYTARILRVIYQVPAGGGAPVIWVTGSSIGNIYDMDFDASGNLWAGGNNPAIYRIKQDKSVKQFPFTCNARSIRVYDGYLYVGGKVDTTEGVWRAQIISSDSLGAFEKFFDFSAKYPGYAVNAVTFAADGDMYIGTDAPEALIVVHPSKAAEPLYPGLFSPTTLLFTWGNADDLYMIRTLNNPRLLRVTMLKNGAPYYGKQL